MQTVFRKATRQDLRAIIAMLVDDEIGQGRESASDIVEQAYLDAFSAIEQEPNHQLIVLEIEGKIAGCLQLSFIPGLSRKGMWRGQIENVRIHRDFRGKGLGEQFFNWAIEECRKNGCGLVQLTTDKGRSEAYRFYERLGFAASHEGMKLDLSS